VTKSRIAWTERVWNPVTGCTKVSAGCKNCYAEAIAHRYWGERKFADVRTHPERLDAPLHWRKPSRVFVNSMSDLFHEDVPDEFIMEVFNMMAAAKQHTFQILTKRPRRMSELLQNWGVEFPNVWLGVSVENQEQALSRIPYLIATPASVRWLSVEPLLGPMAFSANLKTVKMGATMYRSIDWVVVGGESGANHRPMEMAWLESVVRQCRDSWVPVFVKQDSGRFPGKQGRIPNELWIKEYPADVDPRPSPVA